MTIFETLRLHRELAAAAARWKRTRVELSRAATSPAYTGLEIAERVRDHEVAIAQLFEAQDALDGAQLPPVTIGNARRIGQLEGEIALQAITWFHAREETTGSLRWNSTRVEEASLEQTQLLHNLVAELVDELSRLGATA